MRRSSSRPQWTDVQQQRMAVPGASGVRSPSLEALNRRGSGLTSTQTAPPSFRAIHFPARTCCHRTTHSRRGQARQPILQVLPICCSHPQLGALRQAARHDLSCGTAPTRSVHRQPPVQPTAPGKEARAAGIPTARPGSQPYIGPPVRRIRAAHPANGRLGTGKQAKVRLAQPTPPITICAIAGASEPVHP